MAKAAFGMKVPLDKKPEEQESQKDIVKKNPAALADRFFRAAWLEGNP